MKKIALFISSLQKGGSERVMVNLAEYFNSSKYEVILVTQYKRDNEYDVPNGVKRIYSEPDLNELPGNRIGNFVVRYKALRRIWKEHKPDVIMSFLGKNNMMAIITSAFLPVKVAVSVRGEPTMEYEGRLMQMISKLLFGFADAVILQTKQAKEFFPKRVKKKAVVLPNPLNEAFIGRIPAKSRQDLVTAVGRLDENKNFAMLIRAFSSIADEFPNTRLVIYGEGESRKKLEALIRENKMQDRISLPGVVSDVASHIESSKVFVLTSNTEGMPNSIMEAMALGIPVISTDCPCGGPAELIESGVNGILVPVGDAQKLSEALREVLGNPEYAQSLGENAHKITKELHPDKVNKKWESCLTSL